jgi:hypothetical protein
MPVEREYRLTQPWLVFVQKRKKKEKNRERELKKG